jgi:hypothetical protein
LTSILEGKGFVREYGRAATVAPASVIPAFSGELQSPQISSVISDREHCTNPSRAAQHRFLQELRLLEKMNRHLAAILGSEIRRFLKAHPPQCAARVHVPQAGRVFRLFAQFMGHV